MTLIVLPILQWLSLRGSPSYVRFYFVVLLGMKSPCLRFDKSILSTLRSKANAIGYLLLMPLECPLLLACELLLEELELLPEEKFRAGEE